jgi:hypothetical protein
MAAGDAALSVVSYGTRFLDIAISGKSSLGCQKLIRTYTWKSPLG